VPVLPLSSQLANASADAQAAVRALATRPRVDFGPLPRGALALLLARAAREHGRRFIVVVPDAVSGTRLEADLRFFSGDTDLEGLGTVLHYPSADTTPFVDVAPDQRAAMDRLAVLFHLSQGLPWQLLVVPAGALIRRVPPRAALERRCARLTVGDLAERERLLQLLIEGGYLRVPLVEDPGTFAVRGSLIDVFPPHAEQPMRVELDDELIASIKRFDPEDQRTLGPVETLVIHPVRDILLGAEELARARQRVSDLCDALNLPTLRRRQLVEDIASGRRFIGVEGYLPAFYDGLQTLIDYLPADVRGVVVDPLAVSATLHEEYERARRDRDAKVAAKAPVFGFDELYMPLEETRAHLIARPLAVAHRLAVLGASQAADENDDHGRPELTELGPPDGDALLRIAAEDQGALSSELRGARVQGNTRDPLEPLRTRVLAWLDEGLRVVLSARTKVQAERLTGLLRSYELPIEGPKPFDPSQLRGLPGGRTEVVVGPLEDGFVLPSQALVCITEEEIFGTRQLRRNAARKPGRDKTRAFVHDLRELHVGDYVVHVEHGAGIYRGLSLSELPVTRYEALQGQKPKRVEVLVVEYAGGDKLFLPVTRLNQIEKLASKDGGAPKPDRLGGQTFARTKSRVKASVEQLADELLQLYAARGARERPAYPPKDRGYAEFEASFPYEETADQARAIDDVMGDLETDKPMDRLVCGDVGFGKTEVALRAAFRVAMSGRQVAVLCPTTVLAQQHLLTFAQRLGDYPIRVEMLSRFVPKKQQTEVLARLKQGQCDIVIGTHRLLSKDVHFSRLGLLVVDEEQRFGVAHKERIKKLRTEVDVLTLSATPIPRTLHMAIGGLRELSLISTPPLDRRAIRTFVTRWDDHVVREAIARELGRGGQVFFVHNRIDGLYERAAHLQQLVPNARIGVAHGRVSEATLERVMTDFVDGRYDILACTAIVESGLDIPRANTIVIDRADMMGLSQLYQLRGRVGRSRERAYCYLVVPAPSQMSDEARTRMEVLERFSQLGAGFQVASLDMELRGAGDLLGQEQSGSLAAVGFDLFVRMLQEAIAEHRGETVVHEIEPDLAIDMEYYIPEEYVPDVGLRLSFYKRFAAAPDEDSVHELAEELEDRFGPPPPPVMTLTALMALKPALRGLRVLGCDASAQRVTLHFSSDAPLDRVKLAALVAQSRSYQLTPDGKLISRHEPAPGVNGIDRIRTLLQTLRPMHSTD
jgi:transcription-repair coupling factor (superfamily II helicase)